MEDHERCGIRLLKLSELLARRQVFRFGKDASERGTGAKLALSH